MISVVITIVCAVGLFLITCSVLRDLLKDDELW